MSRYDWDVVDEEDENDPNFEDKDFGGKDALLFLIDSTPPMHENFEGSEDDFSGTMFQKALTCAHATLKSRIFGSEKDLIGVLAFGTKHKAQASLDFDHLTEVVPLSQPSRTNILRLEAMMDDNHVVTDQVGTGGKVSLHEALWQCQSTMANVAGKVGVLTVFYSVNNRFLFPGWLQEDSCHDL